MNHKTLDRYSFIWSELRLLIAALALFLGGVPPALYFLPMLPLVGVVLILCWLISGAASLYLIYRWYTTGQMLFGKKDNRDTIAFFVMAVSGINLGLTGLIGRNIGMSISSNYIIFVVVGVLYLLAAYRLYTRWNKSGQSLFSHH